MKTNSIFMAVVLVVTLFFISVSTTACSAPPEELPRAQTIDTDQEQATGVDDIDEAPSAAVSGSVDGEDGEILPNADESEAPVETTDDDSTTESPEQSAEQTTLAIGPDGHNVVFEGFAPGKSHAGTFTDWSGEVTYTDGEVSGMSATIIAASVSSDSSGLDNHLKNEDFFDVENFPEISFVSSSVERDGDVLTVVGDLTFHGVTKTLSFPVQDGGDELIADFVISMKEFGIEYLGVNDEVRVGFTLNEN